MAIIFEKTNLGRYVLKIGDDENCLKNSKNAHTHAMVKKNSLSKLGLEQIGHDKFPSSLEDDGFERTDKI